MEYRFVDLEPNVPTAIQNRSTWMINIGTHKKPYDETEWQFLRMSLRLAIGRVLGDEEIITKIFYPVIGPAGATTPLTQDVFRTRELLGINGRPVADVAIERGTKQGRVDAHIIMEVVHSDKKIQFDNRAFGDILKEELDMEDLSFIAMGIMSQDPLKAGQNLQWANGRLYVTFNRIGRTHASNAQAYLLKQTDPQTRDAAALMADRVHLQSTILNEGYRIGPINPAFDLLPPAF